MRSGASFWIPSAFFFLRRGVVSAGRSWSRDAPTARLASLAVTLRRNPPRLRMSSDHAAAGVNRSSDAPNPPSFLALIPLLEKARQKCDRQRDAHARGIRTKFTAEEPPFNSKMSGLRAVEGIHSPPVEAALRIVPKSTKEDPCVEKDRAAISQRMPSMLVVGPSQRHSSQQVRGQKERVKEGGACG